MTSPVPLRPYHQRSSLGYADSDTKGSAQSYEDDSDLYDDPYANAPHGKPWSPTVFEESAADGVHKPSLSYNTKGLGK
jgi:hypothetical protein